MAREKLSKLASAEQVFQAVDTLTTLLLPTNESFNNALDGWQGSVALSRQEGELTVLSHTIEIISLAYLAVGQDCENGVFA